MTRQRLSMVLIALAVTYATIRLLNLDSLVTTDEPFWLGRSGNFYRAFRSGDFVHTYQMAHPGVMTMWAGAIAYWLTFPEYSRLASANLDDVYFIEQALRSMGQDPLQIMIAAKISKVVLQTLFFLLGLIYLRKLVSTQTVVIVGLLMCFAPFMSGYDSALHVDGLFTTICFTTIAILCYAGFVVPRVAGIKSLYPWILAGMISAAAWLTRATGVVLVGVVGLVLLIVVIDHISKGSPVWSEIRWAISRGVAWLISAIATTFLLLPALWVAPGATLSKLWDWSSNAATEGHENPTFYRGIHVGNPGYQVYPEVLAWRSSPTEWLGILLLLIFGALVLRKKQPFSRAFTRTLLVFGVFAFVYIAAMSVGAKKFDRYILPVFPVITLFAGVGLSTLIDQAKQTGRNTLMVGSRVLVAVLLLVQVGAWASTLPYRLDYYNPILGGGEKAQKVLQMGWGQGGDKVVEFLDTEADGNRVVVQTTAVPSAFTYFLPDDTNIKFESFGLGTPAGWYETDFFVAGVQQTQRNLSPAFFLFSDRHPAQTVDIGGATYFEIFEVRNTPLPPSLLTSTACNFQFGDDVMLMQIIGRDQSVDFYVLSTSEINGTPIEVEVTFENSSGETITNSASFIPAPEGHMSKFSIVFPGDERTFALDQYGIVVSMSSDDSPLPVTSGWLQDEANQAHTQSECYYTESQ